jgi:hypothetical protein
MEWSSTCPLCWVRCQVNPLQQARQYSTQHSWARVGSFHNIEVWGDRFNIFFTKIMLNGHFGHYFVSVGSSPGDYVIYCGQENDIICHPKP